MTALGAFLVLISFVVKRKLLERSVETQDVSLVQKAMVVACAYVRSQRTDWSYSNVLSSATRAYYLLFLLAAAGIALHFPKRSQLEAASYKSRNIVS